MSKFDDRISALQELKVIEHADKFGFLQNITGNWDNHRPMLLLALELTTGQVIEFGSGSGSTDMLKNYCKEVNRRLRSFDNNQQYSAKYHSYYVMDWDGEMASKEIYQQCGLAFIDHAPGEHRKVAVAKMAGKADIIVIHDTEEGGAGNYGFESIWHLFKYRLNYNKNGGGAGATAVSNKIDLHVFRGLTLGQFKFDND